MAGAGILLGILGIIGVGLNYPVYKKLLRSGKELRSRSWPGRSVNRQNELKGGRQMNKAESKYFNTALQMNEALVAWLEKKDP